MKSGLVGTRRAYASASTLLNSRLVTSHAAEKLAWKSSLAKEDSIYAVENSVLSRSNSIPPQAGLNGLVVPSIVCAPENGRQHRLNPLVVPSFEFSNRMDEASSWGRAVEEVRRSTLKSNHYTSETMIDRFVVTKRKDAKAEEERSHDDVSRMKPKRDAFDKSRRELCEESIMGRFQSKKKLKGLQKRVAASLDKIRMPQLKEAYTVDEEADGYLGEGRQGVVRKCNEHATGGEFAVKTCNKFRRYFKKEDIGNVRYEVEVLEKLKGHPNLLKYVRSYESPLSIHIITEVCTGGDLFSFLNRNEFLPQSEQESKFVIAQLLDAVAWCHERGITHLDIKLENLMRREDGPGLTSSPIVLVDFGHSKPLPDAKSRVLNGVPTGMLKRPVGSPSYAAPEVVLECQYNAKSDVWSLGVITYVLLQGYLPYPQLQMKVWRDFTISDYTASQNSPFRYEMDWKGISPEALDFVSRALEVDPAFRMSIEEAKKHPWLRSVQYSIETTHEHHLAVQQNHS